ncbi:MAG TPA: hypothetical protein VM597_34960 [Gemmataceae bacterium]|jgi:DNA-directed RNA polymerase specialized sigma24 family protein|nr:hypothetical protein [Gemmataceae bacterium]
MIDRVSGITSRNGFPSTEWKVVLEARDDDSDGRAALGVLCRVYWYPVYAFVRGKVRDVHKAQDLTQGFFTHLLSNGVVASADQTRGRFRDFLLGCCRNYLKDHWKWFRSGQNGGGVNPLPLDFAAAEVRYRQSPAGPADPEREYTRLWAMQLLERTMGELRTAYAAAGETELFDRLARTLTDDAGAEKHVAIATSLGLTVDQMKKAASRLRAAFKAELYRQVGQTVLHPADVAAEIRELFTAVNRC